MIHLGDNTTRVQDPRRITHWVEKEGAKLSHQFEGWFRITVTSYLSHIHTTSGKIIFFCTTSPSKKKIKHMLELLGKHNKGRGGN